MMMKAAEVLGEVYIEARKIATDENLPVEDRCRALSVMLEVGRCLSDPRAHKPEARPGLSPKDCGNFSQREVDLAMETVLGK